MNRSVRISIARMRAAVVWCSSRAAVRNACAPSLVAIGTHRAKRSKAIGANPLDEIAGIGPARKRALLEHFGSAKAVSRASPDDLRAIDGISAAMAQAIYDFFHERRE